jgi:hypothetical protein
MSAESDLKESLEHVDRIERRLEELVAEAEEAEEIYRDAVSMPSTLKPPKDWVEFNPPMGLA